MLFFDDDVYCHEEYNCTACEQKDFVLKEAAAEVKRLVDDLHKLTQTHSEIEQRLLDNLENACHMLGIPFVNKPTIRGNF